MIGEVSGFKAMAWVAVGGTAIATLVLLADTEAASLFLAPVTLASRLLSESPSPSSLKREFVIADWSLKGLEADSDT